MAKTDINEEAYSSHREACQVTLHKQECINPLIDRTANSEQ